MVEMKGKIFWKNVLSQIFPTFFTAFYSIQINNANKDAFNSVSSERAFADFMFAHVILHLVVVNFIG